MGLFDMNHKNKCPLCGKNMSFLHGDMVCGDCGYRSSYATSSTGNNSSTLSKPQAIPTPKSNHTSIAPTANIPTPKTTSTQKKQKKKSKTNPLIVCFALFYIALVILFICAKFKTSTSITTVSHSEELISESNSQPSLYEEESLPTLPNSLTENSEGIIQTLELLFNKDASEITNEELASIISLEFCYEGNYNKVRCEMNTGSDSLTKELFVNDVSFSNSDYSIFPNLTTLDTGNYDIASLNGLSHLTNLSTSLTPLEISNLIEPTQILSLSLNDLFFFNDFTGIEAFTNLTSLSFDAYYVENFDMLSELKNLKALTIQNGQNVINLNFLYDMPQLEYLNLDCEGLRDIGFISNMPNLSNFTLWYSDIKNIDALADCKDTLTVLDLRYNYEVKDYNVVSELKHLESLSLHVSYDHEQPVRIPQLSNMPNLTHLLLGNFDELSELTNAPNLQSLALHDVYVYDMTALSALQNLTSLELYDMSIEPVALDSIMTLTDLEYLSIESSYIWGNAQQLLSLPNLKEFNMEECNAGFDLTALVPNESLEILNMNHAKLHALENGKWNYGGDNVYHKLYEHTDIFTNYPNLRELYIAEHEIEHVDFMATLPYLEIIDLSDNYTTDLTPLANLSNLKSVMCYNTPIVNDGDLGKKVSCTP